MKYTNVVFVSDTHCGSPYGLDLKPKTPLQHNLLSAFKDALAWAGKPDILIGAGDYTHGLSEWDHETSAGMGQMPAQVKLAAEVLQRFKATEYLLTSGTPVHEGGGLITASKLVAQHLAATGASVQFHRRLRLRVNNWFRITVRHKIGSSKVPWGRFTGPKRFATWQVLHEALASARDGTKPEWPHLCAFGHVHHYTYTEDDYGKVVTLPCWQMPGGVYGDEQCEGITSIGLFKVMVPEKEGASVICDKILFPVHRQQRWVAR